MPINTNINTSRISHSNSYNNNITSIKTNISNAYVPIYNRNSQSNSPSTTIECIDFSTKKEKISLFDWLIRYAIRQANNTKDINYDEASHGTFDSEKVQGITETDKYIYLSSHSPKDELGSRLYVYDRDTKNYIGYITLDSKSHVGGISYDKKNNILYVTQSDGAICAYDNYSFERYIDAMGDGENTLRNKLRINSSHVRGDNYCIVDLNESWPVSMKDAFHVPAISEGEKLLPENSDIDVTGEDNNAATAFYYDNVLYSATFETGGPGELRAYDVVTDFDKGTGKKILKYQLKKISQCPELTQGLAVTDYNGKRYLFTSESLGPFSASSITTFEMLPDGSLNELGKHYFENYQGMEGLYIDEYCNVICVSEFNDETTKIPIKNLITNYEHNDSKINNVALFLSKYGYDKLEEVKDFGEEVDEASDYIIEDLKDHPFKTSGQLAEEIGETITNYAVEDATTIVNGAKTVVNTTVDTIDAGKEIANDAVKHPVNTTVKFADEVGETISDYADKGVDLVKNTYSDIKELKSFITRR